MIIATEITGVRATQTEMGDGYVLALRVWWQKDDGQFGNIDITQTAYDDGTAQLKIDSEMISRDSVKEVLGALVGSAYFPDEPIEQSETDGRTD